MCVMSHFSLAAFQTTLSFQFDCNVSQRGSLSPSYLEFICMVFIKCGKFLAMVSSNIFSAPFSPPPGTSIPSVHVGLFDGVPQSPWALFTFLLSFLSLSQFQSFQFLVFFFKINF